jgi:uncharacterized membrane protein YbhN (UPF0104 family)
MAAERDQRWKLWVRIGVSGGLLFLLLQNIDLDELIPKNRDGTHLAFLALGFLLTGVGIILSAWRWQRVLVAFDAHVPLRTLGGHYFAGQFVGNALPSTIGGDVVRISRCGKTIGSNETAFASVALERLTGFLVLPLISLVGFMLEPSVLAWRRSLFALAIDAFALTALLVILFLAGHPGAAGRFAERENWTRFVGAVHVGVDRLRHEPGSVFGILGTAILYQASVVAAVMCAGRALDLSAPLGVYIAYVPVVAMGQVLPLTLGGLGVREGLLVLFFGPFGVSKTQAVALGLLWYGMVVSVSLLGAPTFAAGQRHAHVAPPQEP